MANRIAFQRPFWNPLSRREFPPRVSLTGFPRRPDLPFHSTSYHFVPHPFTRARENLRNHHFRLEKLNILYICISRLALLESLIHSRPVSCLYSMSLYVVLGHCLSIRDGTSYVVVALQVVLRESTIRLGRAFWVRSPKMASLPAPSPLCFGGENAGCPQGVPFQGD